MPTDDDARPAWRGLTQAELDRQYDQRALVPDAPDYMARWAAASARLRAARPPARLRYGPHPAETLHLHPGDAGGPVHLHVHGGAWRALTADDADFVAEGLGAEGATVAVLGFALAPETPLAGIVAQVRRAALWLRTSVEGADRIHLSGHSSGAHLAACLLDAAWRRTAGLPDDAIASAVLVSGPYDLEPVSLSARAGYLGLADGDVEALSPIRRFAPPPDTAIFWGDSEHEEFRRQSRALAAAASAARAEELPGNHFEMYDAFGDPRSAVARAALAFMAR